MKIQIFWDVMLCGWVLPGSIIETRLHNPGDLGSLATSLRKPQMLFYLSHFTVLSCPLYEAVVVEDSRVSIGGMVEPDKLEINWKEAVTA